MYIHRGMFCGLARSGLAALAGVLLLPRNAEAAAAYGALIAAGAMRKLYLARVRAHTPTLSRPATSLTRDGWSQVSGWMPVGTSKVRPTRAHLASRFPMACHGLALMAGDRRACFRAQRCGRHADVV